MADKRLSSFQSRLAVEGPRRALAKGMENLERERKVSRRDFEKEKTFLTDQMGSRLNPRKISNMSMTGAMTSPVASQSALRLDSTEVKDPSSTREKAAIEACEHLRVQFELTLASLLEVDHPLTTDRRSRPGPAKVGGPIAEDPGSATVLKVPESSGTPGTSIKRQPSIEERFSLILGQPTKTPSASGQSSFSRPSVSFQPLEKSESLYQSTPTSSTSFAVNPEMLQKSPLASRLMSIISSISDPTGPATVSKNHKALRSLLDECRLTVRSIKAGTDTSGRLQARTVKKISDILPIIRPLHRNTGVLSPQDALSCGYLRLSKDQVVRLEDQLKQRGIDPGIHRHTDISDVKLFEEASTSRSTTKLKPMPFHLPATSLQVSSSSFPPDTRKKSTDKRGQ